MSSKWTPLYRWIQKPTKYQLFQLIKLADYWLANGCTGFRSGNQQQKINSVSWQKYHLRPCLPSCADLWLGPNLGQVKSFANLQYLVGRPPFWPFLHSHLNRPIGSPTWTEFGLFGRFHVTNPGLVSDKWLLPVPTKVVRDKCPCMILNNFVEYFSTSFYGAWFSLFWWKTRHDQIFVSERNSLHGKNYHETHLYQVYEFCWIIGTVIGTDSGLLSDVDVIECKSRTVYFLPFSEKVPIFGIF